jgi:hypothetical protein
LLRRSRKKKRFDFHLSRDFKAAFDVPKGKRERKEAENYLIETVFLVDLTRQAKQKGPFRARTAMDINPS